MITAVNHRKRALANGRRARESSNEGGFGKTSKETEKRAGEAGKIGRGGGSDLKT